MADELVLVLSDIALDDGGQLEAPDSGGPAGMVFGREGTHVLVNGRQHATLTVRDRRPAAVAGGECGEEPAVRSRARGRRRS